jgi:nitrogen fixation/metabolism regulation signal transduction histidine kinase
MRHYRALRAAGWTVAALLLLLPVVLAARALDAAQAAALGVVASLVVGLMIARGRHEPFAAQLRALSMLVAAWRDSDFSTTIALPDDPDLADLTRTLNALGDALRGERQRLVQRELLLDTLIQNTPTVVLLADPHRRVVFANLAARALFAEGRPIEGMDADALLAALPPVLREVLATRQDSLASWPGEAGEETWHASRREFMLNGRPHELVVLRQMTRELSRQEVATWKKVIRVISHELNNSLAPISSLAHSGRQLAARGEADKLDRVFATIEERARHLDGFVRGYARFAKLPTPRLEATTWRALLGPIVAEHGGRIVEPLPDGALYCDPAQLAQVLVNLLVNARESGSAPEGVEVAVRELGDDWRCEVRDRGTGMSETVMAQALVPFYSTKRSGTGLGLALVREIIEAHGGRVALANRDGGGLVVALSLPREG